METAIKKYLDNRAKSDELFAAKYANPKKSIDECCKYITGEAYARAKNGCAVISDEEVYGMAVHYYDEENIEIRKAPAGTKVSAGTKVPSKTTKVKLTKAEEEEAQDTNNEGNDVLGLDVAENTINCSDQTTQENLENDLNDLRQFVIHSGEGRIVRHWYVLLSK